MRPVLILIVIAAVALPLAARADDVQDEVKRLQGEWVVTEAHRKGSKLTDDERASDFVLKKAVIDGEQVKLWISAKGEEAKESQPFPMVLDLTQKPRRMKVNDLMMVYQVEGDVLKVCLNAQFSKEEADVPKSFDTAKDENWYLFVFKREKKS